MATATTDLANGWGGPLRDIFASCPGPHQLMGRQQRKGHFGARPMGGYAAAWVSAGRFGSAPTS